MKTRLVSFLFCFMGRSRVDEGDGFSVKNQQKCSNKMVAAELGDDGIGKSG